MAGKGFSFRVENIFVFVVRVWYFVWIDAFNRLANARKTFPCVCEIVVPEGTHLCVLGL